MGFITGVITGIAAAAVAAAWYLSRSGERFREQYRLERRLADLGDELEARTRELQAAVNSQLADLRGASDLEPTSPTAGIDATLDPVAASAAEAEAAAVLEADGDVADDAPTKRDRAQGSSPAE